jgi:hypothetical protein
MSATNQMMRLPNKNSHVTVDFKQPLLLAGRDTTTSLEVLKRRYDVEHHVRILLPRTSVCSLGSKGARVTPWCAVLRIKFLHSRNAFHDHVVACLGTLKPSSPSLPQAIIWEWYRTPSMHDIRSTYVLS